MSESVVSRRDFLQKVGAAVVGGAAVTLLGQPDNVAAQAVTPPKPTIAPPTLTPAEATATGQAKINAAAEAVDKQQRDAFYAKQTAIAPTPAPKSTETSTGTGKTNPNVENPPPQDPNSGLKIGAIAGGGGVAALTAAAEIVAHRKAIGKAIKGLWPFKGRSGLPPAAPAARANEGTPAAVPPVPDAPQVATRVEGQGAAPAAGGMAAVDTLLAELSSTRNTGSAAAAPAGAESVSEAIQQQHDQLSMQMLRVYGQQLRDRQITTEDYARLVRALVSQGSDPASGNTGATASPYAAAAAPVAVPTADTTPSTAQTPAAPEPASVTSPLAAQTPDARTVQPGGSADDVDRAASTGVDMPAVRGTVIDTTALRDPGVPPPVAQIPEAAAPLSPRPTDIEPINGDLIAGINRLIQNHPDWVSRNPLSLDPVDLMNFFEGTEFDVKIFGPIAAKVKLENFSMKIDPVNETFRMQGELDGARGHSTFVLYGRVNQEGKIELINRRSGDIYSEGTHGKKKDEIEERLTNLNSELVKRIRKDLNPDWLPTGFGVDPARGRFLVKIQHLPRTPRN